MQTFWFQAVCANHLVWDAVEVVEFSRKHTANVGDCLGEIRRIVESLVAKRDERRDGFVAAIKAAMSTPLAADAEGALAELLKTGYTRALAAEAVDIARQQGRLTIFTVVDALTRLAGRLRNAGERTDADQKAARLLGRVTPSARPGPAAGSPDGGPEYALAA